MYFQKLPQIYYSVVPGRMYLDDKLVHHPNENPAFALGL